MRGLFHVRGGAWVPSIVFFQGIPEKYADRLEGFFNGFLRGDVGVGQCVSFGKDKGVVAGLLALKSELLKFLSCLQGERASR